MHDAQESQARQDMDGQVQGVIPPNSKAAERVVDGRGKIQERPAFHAVMPPWWGGERACQTGQR